MYPDSVEQAVREAHSILHGLGVSLAPSKVVRLARDYIKASPPIEFATYVENNAKPTAHWVPYRWRQRHLLEWLDPTGDEATANVDSSTEKEGPTWTS